MTWSEAAQLAKKAADWHRQQGDEDAAEALERLAEDRRRMAQRMEPS